VWLGTVDIINRLCFYTSLAVQQRTCLFFTKRFVYL